jgi:hypothetical protein
MARMAPRPPSVVAEPPTPTTMRRAPASSAVAISSPVPWVVAAIGSFPSGPPTKARPDARAISMTAVRPTNRHDASTGSPSGPHHRGGAVAAAQHLERALATIGQRQGRRRPAGARHAATHGLGGLGRRGGAAEFVDRSQHTHGRLSMLLARPAQSSRSQGSRRIR